MTPAARLTALRDQLAQILFDDHQRLYNQRTYPLSLSTLHKDFYVLADKLLPAINAWAGELLAGGDAEWSWSPGARPGCGQRNADGDGPLFCVRAAGHRDAHAFEASAGLNLKESEASQ